VLKVGSECDVVTANCSIEVLAYSAYTDPSGSSCTPQIGHITMNGVAVWQGSWCGGPFSNPRGVNTLLIDPFGCSVQENRTFDTHRSRDAARRLSSYLRQVNRGRVIVGVSADDARIELNNALSALRELGADVRDVRYRGSFAFIAQKGYPSKTALRKVLSGEESRRSPARVNAIISGT